MRDYVVRSLAETALEQARQRNGGSNRDIKVCPKTETVSCYEARLLLYLTANNERITDYSLAIKTLKNHANLPDIIRWLRDRFVPGLNRSHTAVQNKLRNMTKLTFVRAVEIAVNI